jgi:hypothetical protein
MKSFVLLILGLVFIHSVISYPQSQVQVQTEIDADVDIDINVNSNHDVDGPLDETTVEPKPECPFPNCQCNGKLILDGHRNAMVGECQVKDYEIEYFCYVDPDSGCPDVKESSRSIGTFYSNNACECHEDKAQQTHELPLKKITILAENETTAILEWKDGQVIEITLDRIDTDCIYSSEIKEDEGSNILITGCFGEEEITVQVQSEVFGDFLATAAIDGTIKSPPRINNSLKSDTVLSFPGDDDEVSEHPRTKREFVLDPSFFDDHAPVDTFVSKIVTPKELEAELDIYIAPSWRSHFGGRSNGRKKIIRIIKQVALLYKHRSLDTKIDITKVYFNDVADELQPSRSNLNTFMSKLSRRPNVRNSMHLLLTHDGKDYGTLGLANALKMCDKKKGSAASLVKYFHDDSNTAYTIAHELGHLIGMFHDFDRPSEYPQLKARGVKNARKITCGAPEEEGGADNFLMNYELPMTGAWSDCSNEDFKNYYTLIVGNGKEFCLKEK